MIGTLLTVDEVAQWVVHAAQLPQEVADTFRSNRVTGYDFPGLIENQVWICLPVGYKPYDGGGRWVSHVGEGKIVLDFGVGCVFWVARGRRELYRALLAPPFSIRKS